MRKLILWCILLNAYVSFAQNNFDPTGNVGLGVLTPQVKLDVLGAGRFKVPDDKSGIGGLTIETPSGPNLKIGGNFTYSWIQSHMSLPLYINELGNNTIFNLVAGRVGIGTSNPLAKLEVNNGNILVRNSANVDNTSSIMIAHSINEGNLDNFGTSIRTFIQNAGNNTYGMQFFAQESYATGQTEKLRILGNGNVGIGTSNPEKRLQIDASNSDAGIRLHSSQGNNNTNTPYLLLTGGYLPNNGVALRGVADENYGRKAMVFYSGWEGNLDNPAISDLQERMRISSNGNIGIGMANPLNKLDVKGTIHSQEVKVDLNFPAPDYVFTPDYKLRSLQEIEKYVNENSHLPEIPSAKEFEKNGIQLAEMNMALLKKIEELTLYAIEQDKKTDKLLKVIEQQNKRLEALERLKKD
jgi:hypothetical protein